MFTKSQKNQSSTYSNDFRTTRQFLLFFVVLLSLLYQSYHYKDTKYLAGCFLLLLNWGFFLYLGNLLQLTCFLLLPYWGIFPHFQVFTPTSLLPTPIHILKTQNKTSIYVALFYCVLTLYTIYRKSRLSILFDRQGDPSFVYNFI